MKKRILMLTLVLMIVLSSFSMVFASEESISLLPIPSNATSFATNLYNSRLAEYLADYDYVIAVKNNDNVRIYGTNNSNISQLPHLELQDQTYYISNTNSISYVIESTADIYWPGWSDNNGRWDHGSTTVPINKDNIYFCNFPIYGTDYVDSNNKGTQINDYVNPIKTVSINQHQTIVFNYQNQHSTLFMKDLKVTPNKSVVLQQGYYLDGDISFLAIRKDTTGFLNSGALGGYTITMDSFPSPRALNENEYLAYFQSNDLVSLGEKYAYFTIDTTKCSYKIIAKNTGLVIDSGGLNEEISPPGDITDSSDGYNGITDDFTLDKGDYADGILGAVQYGFDQLIKFAKLPFELLYKFIFALGDIIQYALGSVGALTGSLKSLYGILPTSIAYLMTFAITITIFKLIFGR